jgi:hypothetical protein
MTIVSEWRRILITWWNAENSRRARCHEICRESKPPTTWPYFPFQLQLNDVLINLYLHLSFVLLENYSRFIYFFILIIIYWRTYLCDNIFIGRTRSLSRVESLHYLAIYKFYKRKLQLHYWSTNYFILFLSCFLSK